MDSPRRCTAGRSHCKRVVGARRVDLHGPARSPAADIRSASGFASRGEARSQNGYERGSLGEGWRGRGW
eukprot:5624077-Pyramimonas_sp.AAC.1